MKLIRLSSFILAILLLSSMQTKPLKVIFFGDSITQQGANAGGYIHLIEDLLKQKGMENSYQLSGAGIGGNKIYDLFLRFEDDVLVKKPDVVFIYIGINDVWHKQSSQTGTDPDKFEKFYVAMIKKLQANNTRVIVCTPTVIGERNDNSNQLDGDLNRYSNIIRTMAAKNNVQVCDLRKGFMDYELKNNPENKEKDILTADRVHLNPKGNELVAKLMTDALTSK